MSTQLIFTGLSEYRALSYRTGSVQSSSHQNRVSTELFPTELGEYEVLSNRIDECRALLNRIGRHQSSSSHNLVRTNILYFQQGCININLLYFQQTERDRTSSELPTGQGAWRVLPTITRKYRVFPRILA